jgi:hypothetical protein
MLIRNVLFTYPLKMLPPGLQISLWIGLLISVGSVCHSQTLDHSDSLEYQAHLELFDDVIGIESTEIINGPKYTAAVQVSGTHPFYNSSIGANGSVTFSGQPYFNLTLLYDIYLDQLVIQHLRSTGTRDQIILNKARVESFRLHGHTFRNYQTVQDQERGIASGFHDVLYESPSFTLLARRKKDTKVEMGSLMYAQEDKYFLIPLKGKSIPFRGMNTFYQMLDNKALSADLKAIVKKENLNVRKSERDLVAVARHCDAILRKQK